VWELKAEVVPMLIGALEAMTPKLGEWIQQFLGTASEISVQNSFRNS